MRKASLPIWFLLLTTGTMGCEPRQGSETRPVHCTVIVDGPKKLEKPARAAGAGTETDKIAGNVRFRCGSPGAEKLTLKVRLEKQGDGDKWHTVRSQTFTLRGKQTVVEGLKYESRHVEIGCSEGTFRTIVDWSRVSRKDTDGDNLVSGPMQGPCVRIFD